MVLSSSWSQNWAMNVGGVACCWWGTFYTRTFQTDLGSCLNETILFFDKDRGLNYLENADLARFCETLARRVVQDPKQVEMWCAELVQRTDETRELLENLEKDATPSNEKYHRLLESIARHIPPNFAIKKVADFLPPDVMEKHMAAFTHAREYAENIYPRMESVIRCWNKSVAKKTGLSAKDVGLWLDAEWKEYFKTGTVPSTEVLADRRTGCLLHYRKGKPPEVVSGKKSVAGLDRLVQNRDPNALSGQTAFPGKVTGRVRIILDPANVKDFKTGDILVTGMTRPEYLPLMKKAAGFVTDAGGMLSHAAITARELKKPCLVGTQNATRFFKDGETVELDAGKALVRRLTA